MKKTLKLIGLLLLIGIIYLVATNYRKTNIITGYSSKFLASTYFMTGRSQDLTEKNDLDFSPINLASSTIDPENKSVVSKVFGLGKRTAIYHDGLGATLVNDDYDPNLKVLYPHRTKANSNIPYPFGTASQSDTIFKNINYKTLHNAVESVFDNGDGTRSVVVLYKDQIIAEKYADGFDKNSILIGWSMTKSITSTLFGILQKQGKIDIYKDHVFPEWDDDERSKITLNDLLHMKSGLAWEEDYSKISDVTKMLFLDGDMSKSQLIKPAKYPPNTHWNYSSGTTNLLSGYLRKQFDSQQEYLDFWYEALIDKIGMNSMIIETDQSGHFVGSSFGWATTRDWAKFGLLYLHQGNWNGEQLIDTSWVNYSAKVVDGSDGKYGGHFWLNAGGYLPDVPKNVYSANGFQNQRVYIIPDSDLVVVRLGLEAKNSKKMLNDLVSGVIKSIQ